MTDHSSHDWLSARRGSLLAWWLPIGAMLLAIPFSDGPKTAIWVVALAWMGIACLRNVRRCGRVHCLYTGPFLLAMTLPGLPMVPECCRWAVMVGAGLASLSVSA